jgi:hypothetical protein
VLTLVAVTGAALVLIVVIMLGRRRSWTPARARLTDDSAERW